MAQIYEIRIDKGNGELAGIRHRVSEQEKDAAVKAHEAMLERFRDKMPHGKVLCEPVDDAEPNPKKSS